MSASDIVSVEIELISLALVEECRKILETRTKTSTSLMVDKTLASAARTIGRINTTISGIC